MKISRKVKTKLYNCFATRLVHKKTLQLPVQFENKKNLFLYFDYEREFGRHETRITNKEVKIILEILEKQKIKTTWFTVGKIFEQYPESIRDIIKSGHEIGSHTYAHIPLHKATSQGLKYDFHKFREVSKPFTDVKGFHSPNGRWNISSTNQLNSYAYQYDVISCGKGKEPKVFQLKSDKKKILRLSTLGDDYFLYKKDMDGETVKQHFIKLYSRLNDGLVGGIGFHPWVLFSDVNILKGFKEFIEFLCTEKNLNIDMAIKFVLEISNISTESHKK